MSGLSRGRRGKDARSDLGGGVIGTSIAYQLAARGAEAVVVECRCIARAASGKSGGFLARDWCDGTPLETLARRSFDLHAKLTSKLGLDWGYWPFATCGGIFGGTYAPRQGGPGWVSS